LRVGQLMNTKVEELRSRINEIIDELMTEYPEEGFLLVSLTDIGDGSVIMAASNINEGDVAYVMEHLKDLEDLSEARSLN